MARACLAFNLSEGKGVQLIRLPSNRGGATTEAVSCVLGLVSLISRFHDDTGDLPPIKFETGHQGKEAERLTRFIWNQVIRLLLAEQGTGSQLPVGRI